MYVNKRSRKYDLFKIWDKRKGLRKSPKGNNIRAQYVETGNEDINESEDINP